MPHRSSTPTAMQRFRYFFDNIMAAGTPAMIGMLALLSLVIILIATVIIFISKIGPDHTDFGTLMWYGLMHSVDAGAIGGDSGSWWYLLVMLIVTFGGIFVFSTLIGVLNSGVEGVLEELRKGRSLVLETNHTVILGWSPQIFTIIPELILANESQKSAVIVILADRDKVEMEDELRGRIDMSKKVRIICRSGNPIDPNDLEIINPHVARSFIILPPEDSNADAFVVKTCLALTNNPKRRPEPYQIVTQVQEPSNMNVLNMIGVKDHLRAIPMGDLIARVTAQTSRQSGLSVVYTELLDFGGDEIYFQQEATLAGKTFGEVLSAYEHCCVLGLVDAQGTVQLNPEMNTVLNNQQQLIVLAEDNTLIRLRSSNTSEVQPALIVSQHPASTPQTEKALILGWNDNAHIVVQELDSYVAQGSTLTIVSDIPAEDIQLACVGLLNQKLEIHDANSTNREFLDSLGIANFDHVIVLSDHRLEVQEADAHTLITLLHLRDIAEKDATPFSIVSEMLDLRNRKLAEATRVDDFIVSEHLISLMLAQLSENQALYSVFTDLFDPEGAEIYLKPISDYVSVEQPVNFYTLVEAARLRGETAFGYRLIKQGQRPDKDYGVHTNPVKSELVTFSADDKLIVLANQ